MTRGLFVVFEGIDGSGKSTQVAAVAPLLRGLGQKVHVTREMSDGRIGRFVRNLIEGSELPDWRTMALLFAADRRDHITREIEPALARGEIVLCDRYLLSSLMYQGETSGVPREEAERFVRWVNVDIPRPDLTCILTLNASTAAFRRGERAGQPQVFEKLELQRRLAAAYAKVVGPGIQHVRADGCPDEITRELVALIMRERGMFPVSRPTLGVKQ